MLFNSLEFIYGFLPITFGLFYLAAKFRLLKLCTIILLVASLFFYAYWNFFYFFLILFKIVTNYGLSLALEKHRSKWILWFSIIFNIGMLCYFKYLNFFISIFNPNMGFIVNAAIPLGISFYTFTQIAYMIDIYQGKSRLYGLRLYSLFVVFFPHLIAGPIIHYSQIMPQFQRIKTYIFTHRNFILGVFFFLIGLFQKVVIADFLSPIADTGFLNASLLTLVEAWSALLAYALQIYFDFAGYSNMAIGLGLLFNIRFPNNFNSPYQATSLIDFWRRWHMTLTQFLRDYIYVPLGGNRLGPLRKYLNILITMFIAGVWHGAGWTFMVWGIYHGVLVSVNHALEDVGVCVSKIIGRVTTFIFVLYGWVFFRSATMSQATSMTKGLLGLNGWQQSETYFLWKYQFIGIVVALAIALFLPNTEFWSKKIRPNLRWGFLFLILLCVDLLYLNRESAFLYFQF